MVSVVSNHDERNHGYNDNENGYNNNEVMGLIICFIKSYICFFFKAETKP